MGERRRRFGSRPARVIDIGAPNRNLRTPPPTERVVHGAHTPVTHSGPSARPASALERAGPSRIAYGLGAPGPVAEAFRRRSRFIRHRNRGSRSVRWGETRVKVSAMCFGGAGRARNPTTVKPYAFFTKPSTPGWPSSTTPGVQRGRAKELMGKGLQETAAGVPHDQGLLARTRDKHVAMQQLERSLRRRRPTISTCGRSTKSCTNDPDRHSCRTAQWMRCWRAKQQGKVRFIGFTGHKHPAIHLKMLSHDFPFDACQMPLNVFDGTTVLRREVLPVLARSVESARWG